MHPSRLRLGPSQSRPPHRREPRIGAIAGAEGLPGSAFAPPEYPYRRSFSNRMPVLSSLSGHEVNDIAQPALGPHRCPPKAEATGSNPVGRAIAFNYLAVAGRFAAAALPAHCPRYVFDTRSGPRPFGSVGFEREPDARRIVSRLLTALNRA